MEKISAEKLYSLVNSDLKYRNILIIDVRPSRDYYDYHINGAINISYSEIMENMREILNGYEKAEIIVYCEHGGRSIYVAEKMRRAGYDAKSLSGGISEYLRVKS